MLPKLSHKDKATNHYQFFQTDKFVVFNKSTKLKYLKLLTKY